MRTIAGPLALLLILFVFAGDTPAKERPEYVLTLKCAEKSVALGEMIDFEVAIEKKAGKPVEINALRLARNSVSLRVSWGGRKHTITRIYGDVRRAPDGRSAMVRDTPPPKAELERDKPLELKLPILAIRPGKLTFQAVYTGLSSGPPVLESEEVEIEVKAPEGKKEIAAVLTTSEGEMTLAFQADTTFNTVLNFLTLAQEGRYDGLVFHRVIKGFMAQGGDPKGDGTGGPGWYIHREIDPALKHEKGVLSMARTSAPHSAGSQFFLMHAKNAGLDGQYSAFGRVVAGLPVVDRICNTKVGPMPPRGEMSKPVKPPVIKSVKVTTR